MITPARHPRIDEPVETRRQIFDHTGRLPSPRTGNGRHHPQSAAGPTFMREPCPHPRLYGVLVSHDIAAQIVIDPLVVRPVSGDPDFDQHLVVARAKYL